MHPKIAKPAKYQNPQGRPGSRQIHAALEKTQPLLALEAVFAPFHLKAVPHPLQGAVAHRQGRQSGFRLFSAEPCPLQGLIQAMPYSGGAAVQQLPSLLFGKAQPQDEEQGGFAAVGQLQQGKQ